MAAPHIVRDVQKYNLPAFTPRADPYVSQFGYSEYYLDNLSLPQGKLNTNLLRRSSDNLSPDSSPGRTQKRSSDTQLHSLLVPRSVPRKESVSGQTAVASFLAPTSPESVSPARSARVSSFSTPRAIHVKIPPLPRSEKAKSCASGRTFPLRDLARVSDVRDVFRKIVPEKYPPVRCRASPTPRRLQTRGRQHEFDPKGECRSASSVVSEKCSPNSTPVTILDMFGDMISINMHHVAKLLKGSKNEQREVLLRLKPADLHADLCDYNSRTQAPGTFILPISPLSSGPCSGRPSYDRRTGPRKKPRLLSTFCGEDLVMPRRTVGPFYGPDAILQKEIKQGKPVVRKNVAKKRSRATFSRAPARVRDLLQVVNETTSHMRKIAAFCRKCKRRTIRKAMDEAKILEIAKKMRDEGPLDGAKTRTRRACSVVEEGGRLYERAAMQVTDERFNIVRRYQLDTAGLDNFRRKLFEDYKLAEKVITGQAVDRFGGSRHGMIRNDRFVSRLIYSRKKGQL